MAPWILLENVLLYGKLTTFWALNIVFHLQSFHGSFRLSPTVLLKLRFGAVFGQLSDIPACSLSHARQNSD